jgi:hypothetical protein
MAWWFRAGQKSESSLRDTLIATTAAYRKDTPARLKNTEDIIYSDIKRQVLEYASHSSEPYFFAGNEVLSKYTHLVSPLELIGIAHKLRERFTNDGVGCELNIYYNQIQSITIKWPDPDMIQHKDTGGVC